MTSKIFVRLSLDGKTYQTRVSSEGCEYVDDFRVAIKNKFTPELDFVQPYHLKLFKSDGSTEIDPMTPMQNVSVTVDMHLVVKVEQLPLDLAELVESKATFEAATYPQIKDATGVRTDAIVTWDIAAVVDTSVPLPGGLLARLKNVLGCISIASEADRRIVINECLVAVVSNTNFQHKLRLSAEITTEVYGDTRAGQKRKRQYLSGRVDYIIYRFRSGQPVEEVSEKEAQLVTVEAKHGWTDNAMRQCVAEAAAIHKARKDAGKVNCQVWGCLTNASLWRFIRIDDDGALFVSEPFTMALGVSSITEQELSKIYQLLYYVVKCAYLASPTTTPNASRRPSQSQS